jgi:RNA polymerase sigma-70 factor (ECF subfamily)
LLREEIDDAVQEVFLDFFKEGGALERVSADRPGGFRAFLYGVARNVALRVERRRARRRDPPGEEAFAFDRQSGGEEALSVVFDRAWAETVVRQARARQAASAAAAGPEAERRVRLLGLRFGEGMPIREIARAWKEEPASLHRAYARARREFHDALLAVVAELHPGATPGEVDRACRRLLGNLG